MILPPWSMWVRVASPGRRGVWIWLPLFLVWLSLLPFALLALALTLVADLALLLAGREYHHYTLLLLRSLGLLAATRGMAVRIHSKGSIVDLNISWKEEVTEDDRRSDEDPDHARGGQDHGRRGRAAARRP